MLLREEVQAGSGPGAQPEPVELSTFLWVGEQAGLGPGLDRPIHAAMVNL